VGPVEDGMRSSLVVEGAFISHDLTSPNLISSDLISPELSDCILATQFTLAATNENAVGRTAHVSLASWNPVKRNSTGAVSS